MSGVTRLKQEASSANSALADMAALKRKRALDAAESFVAPSPIQSGAGTELMGQVVWVVEWLKTKERPVSFEDIWAYLHSSRRDQQQHRTPLQQVLMSNARVEYMPNGIDDQPAFRYRSLHPVRSEEELKAYLQSQTTAKGIVVAELKEGWPSAVATINDMAAKGDVLVTRHKKDDNPRMVWNNDNTLTHHIDDDFLTYWRLHQKLPDSDVLRSELVKARVTPTSQVKEQLQTAGAREKKRRINRKIGKTTNLHMVGILKDYSKDKR